MAQGKEIGSIGLGQDPSNIAADGLTRAQSARGDIVGVAAVDGNGGIYDAAGNKVSHGGGGSLAPYLGVVATRCAVPNYSQSGATQINSGVIRVATDDISQPVLEYHNWQGVSENGAPGSRTVMVALEYPIGSDANIMPINGGTVYTVPKNGYVIITSSEKLPRTIPKGAKFRERVYTVGASAGTWPLYRDGLQPMFGLVGDYCDYGASGITNTVLGGVSGTGGDIYGYNYRAAAIADITSHPTWFIDGDSRNQAAFPFNGNLNGNGIQGLIARIINATNGYINVAVSGDSYYNIVGAGGKSYANRLSLSKYCSHIMGAKGVNDPNLDLATFRTYTQAFAALFPNKPFWHDTIFTRTSTKDFWQTVAKQTINASATNLVAINQAIRAGQVGYWITNFIDSASAIEDANNPGYFRVDTFRVVTDGVQSAGSGTVTSATANFTQADVGKSISAHKTVPITGITWSGGVATATAPAHGRTTGSQLAIVGATYDGYNSTVSDSSTGSTITVVDANTFTYPVATNPGGASGACNAYTGLSLPSAIIKTVNSPTSVTCTNNTGGFSIVTAGTGCLFIIGAVTDDGLHIYPIPETMAATSPGVQNIKTVNI